MNFHTVAEQLAALGSSEGLCVDVDGGAAVGCKPIRPTLVVGQESESPGGNTGDRLTVGKIEKRQDWLNCTFPASRRGEVKQLVDSYIGQGKRRERGTNTYLQSDGWESGAILAWTEGRPECWLSFNGDSCDLILPDRKLVFFRELQLLDAKCTRGDYAIDVPKELVTMERIHEAARLGQVVGFRRYFPKRVVRDMNTGELDQDEADFGRRGRDGSGRYVRWYDKGLESDGEIDRIRCEVETSGDTADAWFQILCDSHNQGEFDRTLGRIVCGSIGFADKSGAHGHADRYQTLPWWDRIVQLVGDAAVVVARVKPSLERSVQYLKRVVPMIFARAARVVTDLGMDGEQVVVDLVRKLLDVGAGKLALRGDPPPLDCRIDFERLLELA